MDSDPKHIIIGGVGARLHASVGHATMDTRYSFTRQFLAGADLFARRAAEIEAQHPNSEVTDLLRTEHRANVVAAVMQAAAAMEADIAEVLMHGPAYHLGSSEANRRGHDRLAPFAELVDRQPNPVSRYGLILKLLEAQPFDEGAHPFQSAQLLVKLRNEVTHYKSRWGSKQAENKLLKDLRALRHTPPPFYLPTSQFFPFLCLSAECARWAASTARAMIARFHELLGAPSSPVT